METSFEWPAQVVLPRGPSTSFLITYIGGIGNVWLLDFPGGTSRQVTVDSTSQEVGSGSISYKGPRLSSDGLYLAYRRGVSKQLSDSMQVEYGLWIADLGKGEATLIYEKAPPDTTGDLAATCWLIFPSWKGSTSLPVAISQIQPMPKGL
jgi:hypothetical protein